MGSASATATLGQTQYVIHEVSGTQNERIMLDVGLPGMLYSVTPNIADRILSDVARQLEFLQRLIETPHDTEVETFELMGLGRHLELGRSSF